MAQGFGAAILKKFGAMAAPRNELAMSAADEELVASFFQSGYLQLDRFVTGRELEDIRAEFHDILARDHPCFFGRVKYKAASGKDGSSNIVRAHPAEMAAARLKYPALQAFVANRQLRSLVSGYISRFLPRSGIAGLAVNHQIELEHNDRPGDGHSGVWHFDRVPRISCALFLGPTTLELGAFQVLPGSHFASRRVALQALERNPDPIWIDNYMEFETPPEATSLEVEEGSVVIFDSFAVHRGGNVTAPGGERTVIRAHTWLPALTREYLSAAGPGRSSFDSAKYRLFFPFDRTGQSVQDPRHRFAG
jgi:ectoine hydroxylase-related dioxygenase (phytanoyl-CoA dioxygenase family)